MWASYGLAVDELVASIMQGGQAIPPEIVRLIEQVAITMGLTTDNEHTSVAALLARVH